MERRYEKLLFDQLRLAVYSKGAAENVTDERMAMAVTVNENLRCLGCMLSAADIVRLAASASLEGFFASVQGLVDRVNASPMYPDFPQQVMDMEEAEFRFHQMLHYFSTYGLEALFGVEVTRGWMPAGGGTPKTRRDAALLPERVIALIDEADQYAEPAKQILRKRERMTLPETEIIAEAVRHMNAEEIAALQIPFKENMLLLADAIVAGCDAAAACTALRRLFAHTGDVLAYAHEMIRRSRYHLRTSQKRLLVRLIESYPVADWKANVILSNKKARKTHLVLNHLDYGMYSRSAAHMAVVDALRDGELRSWESQAKALLAGGDDGALSFIGRRPGMLLRMTAWLLRMGYAPDAIAAQLTAGAASLSVQTLVTTLNFFGSDAAGERREAPLVYDVLERALAARMKLMRTPLKGKRVFVDDRGFCLSASALRCNNKSAEGGYISSGVAYAIPKEARYIRFFVYWDDKQRVDIDLHGAILNSEYDIRRVGWDGDFRNEAAVYSGDITHSNAAEYIDIDMNSDILRVGFNIHLFGGRETFDRVETCLTGLMAVRDRSKDVTLHDARNSFFSHRLRSGCSNMVYGYVDVQNRRLVFIGEPQQDWGDDWYALKAPSCGRMNMERYLHLLMEAQGCAAAESRQDADVVLVMGKPADPKEISLADSNFFMDAPVRK